MKTTRNRWTRCKILCS